MDQDSSFRVILLFWERKRILYNATLLLIGLSALLFSKSIFVLPIIPLIIGILVYGIGANILYTLGSYMNLCAVSMFGQNVGAWSILYYVGLGFSALFTAFIAWVSLYAFSPF